MSSATSTPGSESATLTPNSPQYSLEPVQNHDRPIEIDAFLRHVTYWKVLLGIALVGVAGVEAGLLIDGVVLPLDKTGRQAALGDYWATVAGLILTVLSTILFTLSLIYPPRRINDELVNLGFHRSLCMVTFFSTFLLLVFHAVPGIAYTYITHHPSPVFHSQPYFYLVRTLALLFALVASGSIRRGPKLHYTPVSLGTGFGINAASSSSGGKAINGLDVTGDSDVEVQAKQNLDGMDQNVLDYDNNSMLSFIFLAYMAKLARRSASVEQLDSSDLPHLEEYIRRSGADLDLHSNDGQDGGVKLTNGQAPITKWMLVKGLWRGRGMAIFITFCVETITTAFSYLQIFSMHEIIASFGDATGGSHAYARLMCWGLFVGQAAECLLQAYSWSRENYLLHMPVKMALSTLLFRKILRTTDVKTVEAHNLTEKETEAGKGRSQVMNLLVIDSTAMAGLATHVWNASNALIAFTIGVIFLYQMFGISALIGIACVPLSAPLSIYVSKQSYRGDRAWARARDARASAIKEFLLCYKVIKLNAFEPYFQRRIQRLRNNEVTWQRWRFTLGTLYNILADQLPAVAIFVTFFFHTKVFGHRLEPETAFVAITVFNRVKGALQFVPYFIQDLLGTIVAFNRLVAFLNRPEVDLTQWAADDKEISFSHATVSWPVAETHDVEMDVAQKPFRLHDLDFALPRGKFTLVCGPLGSGKTLLLRALLGEAMLDQGIATAPRTRLDATPLNGHAISGPWSLSTWLDDSVSYAPQQAYIRHGTIRDNVLFGQPMWRSRYKEALRQAALFSDLETFPDGDLTEVGDHGVNLSGGQKARVNLARCIYSRSKTVYLDDILSAVDAHTAQYIFEECLQGSLLKHRTVVLVSHQVGLVLPAADFIVSLKDGHVEQACPVSEATVDELEELQNLASPVPDIHSPLKPMADDLPAQMAEEADNGKATTRQVYKAEAVSVGRVARNHYMLVFTAAGGLAYWIALVIIFAGTTAVNGVAIPLFFRHWTMDAEPEHLDHNLRIYLLLVSGAVVLGGMRWVWLYGMYDFGFYNRGSRRIHAILLDRILSAPLGFFESTPMGRLMNVFGGDVNRLDANSADDFGRTAMSALFVFASFFMVCFQAPAMLSILIVFGPPLYYLSGVLGKLRADLRRLTSIAKSPLVTLYNDAIEGIVMIRAFGSSRVMVSSMLVLLNRDREAESSDRLVYNWVRGVLRAIASVFVTATGFVLVTNGTMSGPQAGFILSFALGAQQSLFNLLETFSNLEQTFVSAERINHYIKMDMAEPTGGITPEKDWPSRGHLKVKDLCVRYAPDLPDVLHGVSFEIQPGMRVGLLGSTGSGKSTLALALFRAIEAHQGSIEIDGIDVSTIRLADLRGRLNMVVQDASLCSGSLRDALDITGEIDDHKVYEALRRVHLIPEDASAEELRENPFTNLDTFVAVQGANFSHGQRQLLCLARALLKPGKILVMDEATSSVDFEMDAKITETIKECFKETTMLVIAHRLATIMHYDRVLVLDKGVIKEFGCPADLIKDEASAFYGLCMAQGEEEYDKLVGMIKT